jgi:hypothetical protein
MLEYTARPDDLLIYYGWLNSFNSATNAWNNEKVAQELAKYNMLVLGDGIQNPAHGDFTNTQIILPRVKALNPEVLIFGYVTVNQTLGDFQTKTDQWDTLQVNGIFFDEAGYDYGKTRAEFNDRVNYVKGKTYSKLCFANAWNLDNILGIIEDPSYPNATFNAGLVSSALGTGDWALLESFTVNTAAYSGNNGYAAKADWHARGTKAAARRNTYNVKMAGSHVIDNSSASGQTLFNYAYNTSMAFATDAVGSSDTNYGASSAASKYWTRPTKTLGTPRTTPSVSADASLANVYWRYSNHARMKITYSASPTVLVENY